MKKKDTALSATTTDPTTTSKTSPKGKNPNAGNAGTALTTSSATTTTSSTSSSSNDDDDLFNALSDAWVMSDSQENFLHGREAYGISLDAIVIICLNQMLLLRNQMLQHILDIFHAFEISQFDKGKDEEVNGVCELNAHDFNMLLWSIDPTISEGTSRLLFEQCVDATLKETQRNGGARAMGGSGGVVDDDEEGGNSEEENEDNDSVELDEISNSAFLKVCEGAGMLRGWCKTYGKRPHTTGGIKVQKIEKRKEILKKVRCLCASVC